MSKVRKDEKLAKQNRKKLGVLMRLLRVRNHDELAYKLCMSPANLSRIASGQYLMSDRIFLRAAILLDMKPSELMKKLDLDEEYFFEVFRKDRGYESKES